jgi:uncharacterized membrane protein
MVQLGKETLEGCEPFCLLTSSLKEPGVSWRLYGDTSMNTSQLLRSTLACAAMLGVASAASIAAAQPMKMTPEMMKAAQQKTMKMMEDNHYTKCFGVNAAYKNDCQSPGHSCAGQDAKARDTGAFVLMPAGVCQKIAGGSSKAS